MPESTPPPPSAMLPQRGPALLIDEVCQHEPDNVRARAIVPETSPFNRDGRAPAYLAIELGAQAAATGEAAGSGGGAEVRPVQGYVVSVRDARFFAADLPVGVVLDVSARLLEAAPPLRTWSVGVARDGELLAEAVVSTFAGPAGADG